MSEQWRASPFIYAGDTQLQQEYHVRPYQQLWVDMKWDVAKYDHTVRTTAIQHPTNGDQVRVDRYIFLQKKLVESSGSFGYLPEDIDALSDAITLCNVHQLSEDEERNYRKFESIPYANHPMETALRLLEMRQDMKMVIACLLHDGPEDWKYKELQSPQEVLDFVRWKFRKYDPQGDIVKMISAETKTSGEELKQLENPEVQEYLLNSGIGKLIVQQSVDVLSEIAERNEEISLVELTEKDRLTICTVIYDMCRVFEASFIGDTFDPRIIALKGMDIWENLRTEGFWLANLQKKDKGAVGSVAKLIRTRIFINLMETLGYREVASEMTEMLSRMQNIHDILKPSFGKQEAETSKELRRKRKQIENDLKEWYLIHDPYNVYSIHVYWIMPWGQEADESTNEGLTPNVYIRRLRRRKAGEEGILREDRGFLENQQYIQGLQTTTLMGMLQNLMGRPIEEYELIKVNGGKTLIGRIRVEDSENRWSHTTKAKHKTPSDPALVPEKGLIHKDLTLYARAPGMPLFLQENGGIWLEAFPYFLSPRLYRQQGDGDIGTSFAVIIDKKLFLAKNIVEDGSVWKICEDQGIDPETALVRSLEDTSAESWMLLQNDSEQLTKIIKRKIQSAKDDGREPPGSKAYFYVVRGGKKNEQLEQAA